MDFNTHKEAMIAKSTLAKTLSEIWNNEWIIVNWAVPEPNGEKMENVSGLV